MNAKFLLCLFASSIALAQEAAPVASVASVQFAHESELGITSSKSAKGSSKDSDLYFGKHKSVADFGLDIVTLNGNYFYGKTGAELSARNWQTGLRYDRKLSDKWAAFASEAVEGNKFMGYTLRSNTDVGGKYFFSPQESVTDLDYFFVEAGYRLTYEDRKSENTTFQANSTSSKARIFTEYSVAWNKTLATKAGLEYLKTLGNDNRDMYNLDLSALSKMTDTVTLKAGYALKYDDTLKKQGFEKSTDSVITVSLIANY
jgi:hypothetical protein